MPYSGDRATSGISLHVSTGPILKIKVTHFELDPEIRLRRSITSDNFTANGSCVPCTVFESMGGIIRGIGFVDPADTLIASMLSWWGTPVTTSDFDEHHLEIVLDIVNDSAASRYGFTMGTTSGDAKIFPMGLSGDTDGDGMILIHFEIHSQKGVLWQTNMT